MQVSPAARLSSAFSRGPPIWRPPAHVARRRHDVRALLGTATIASIRPGSSEPSAIVTTTKRPPEAADARLHRVQNASAQLVAMTADRGKLPLEGVDDWDCRVLVEVVDDEDLVRRRDGVG